jgi:uncharacterized RDD family membrane protein YckC
MNWYYADGGQQAGPVDDLQFEQLVRAGRVQPDTLVWHEGLANWQPYRDINPAAAPTPPSTSEGVCAQCGKVFNLQDMILYGTVRVCASCKPTFVQRLAEGAQISPGSLRYAGFWIRFAAKLVDGLILGIPLLVPFFIFFFRAVAQRPGGFNSQAQMQIQGFNYLFQIIYMTVSITYNSFFLAKFGATPGKMLCGLKVVSEEGAALTTGKAVGRAFAEMLSGLICNIGYIIAAFDDEKRALHDRMCGTRVIYK